MKCQTKDVTSFETSPEKGCRLLQYACALSVSMAVMECGVSLAWSSPMLPYLMSEDSEIPLSEIQGSWIISLYYLGGMLGSLVSPWTMDRLGRKYSFMAFSVPVIFGWILLSSATNHLTLCIGRFFIGIGDGGLLEFISIYLGEITEKDIRGKLSIITKTAMLVGIFFENAVGSFLPFKVANTAAIIIPLLFVMTFLFMPESPYIYLIRDREKDAMQSLMKLRGMKHPDSVQADLDVMKKAVMESQKRKNHPWRELISRRGNRKRLLILLMAKLTRNLSGSFAMVSFAHQILSHSSNTKYAVMVVCAAKVTASLLSSQLVDRVGRRVLFLATGIICFLALGTLAFFFLLQHWQSDVSSITWLPLVAVICYEIGYYMGLSPVCYVLQGELFPLNVKGAAVAIATLTELFSSFILGFAFPAMNHFLGIYSTFFMFATCCITGSVLVFWNMPETKGKTLEEVEAMINPKKEAIDKPLLVTTK